MAHFRSMMFLVTCGVLSAGCGSGLAAQPDQAERRTAPAPALSSPTTPRERLTALNPEFRRQIVEVADGVHVAKGYGASTITMIEADDGVIFIDAGQFPAWTQQALIEFRKINDRPILAIVYTHGHGDHINGAPAMLADSPNASVWARANFNVETNAFRSVGITINRDRGARQAGFRLPPEKRINNGIAPAVYPPADDAFNASDSVSPTDVFEGERTSIEYGGVSLELVANPGETKDQLYVWYPEKNVLFAGDNFYKSWPNLYAIRGTPYRDVAEWVAAIDRLRQVQADVLVGGHTLPIVGAEAVAETLNGYHAGVSYVFNKTIEGINLGLTPDELVTYAALPAEFSEVEVLAPLYGNPEWAVRSIFNGYLGWFDGNPTNLFPLSPSEQADRMTSLVGGPDQLLEAATAALQSNDPQWAAQLSDALIHSEYKIESARELKAQALEQLGERQLTATARNYYFTSAQELRAKD